MHSHVVLLDEEMADLLDRVVAHGVGRRGHGSSGDGRGGRDGRVGGDWHACSFFFFFFSLGRTTEGEERRRRTRVSLRQTNKP